MADFVAPVFQNPDFLRAAALGQVMGQQRAHAPGEYQAQQQGLQSGALNLQQLQMAMRFQQMKQNALGGALSELGSGSSQPQSSSADQTQSADQSSGNFGFAPNPLSQQSRQAIGMLAPEMLKGLDEGDASALKAAQLRSQMPGSPLVALEAFSANPNAGKALLHPQNINAIKMWPQIAQRNGLNPQDLSDINVQMGATLEANRHRAALGMPPLPMPKGFQTVQQGGGQSYQVQVGGEDPGKISGGASALPTEKYIVNGQVVERPKAQGVAQGLTPYDTSLFAASMVSKPALEDAYQQTKATGTPPPTAGRDPIAIAQEKSYIADRMKQDGVGNTGEYLAAKQQAYAAQQKVVSDFTDPSGKAGGALIAINTAVKHVGALTPLIDAMGSGNLTRINQARQAYQRATGVAAPTNYQTLANMAVGEINKAVTANGGDAAERESIAAPFDASGGPEVLKGAVQTAVTALAGKTDALRNAWDVGTNGTQGSFDKLLLPTTKKALGSGDQGKSALPPRNPQGWVLHKDSAGNQAYVSPDGKQFQEVR